MSGRAAVNNGGWLVLVLAIAAAAALGVYLSGVDNCC
jgi:hypothetical protein